MYLDRYELAVLQALRAHVDGCSIGQLHIYTDLSLHDTRDAVKRLRRVFLVERPEWCRWTISKRGLAELEERRQLRLVEG